MITAEEADMTPAFKHEDAAAEGKTSICSMFVVGTFVSCV